MSRPGVTLIDQLLAISLLGVLMAIVLQGAGSLRDRVAVRAASREVRDALALAREHAVAGGTRAAVRFGRVDGTVTVHIGGDSLHRLRLAQSHGVSLDATRDSTAYLPSGLGLGGANVSVVLRRGRHADTVTVSRLGRVR
jgi:type II secretory pathway pseudopilin PulG